jgi:hypothetical protein
MYNKIDINAEHNELILKNSHGDHTIIPADKRAYVQEQLKAGNHAAIDDLVEMLPTLDNYAEDGTVIPGDPPNKKKPVIMEDIGNDTLVAPELNEVVIKDAAKPTVGRFFKMWGNNIPKAESFMGALGQGIGAALSLPQAAATYIATDGRETLPGTALKGTKFDQAMDAMGNIPGSTGLAGKILGSETGQNVLFDPVNIPIAKGVKALTATGEVIEHADDIAKAGSKVLNKIDDVIPKKQWYDNFHLGELSNELPINYKGDFIERGVATERALNDFFNTGIIRNNKSAGLPLNKRSSNYGERVFFGPSSESSILPRNNYTFKVRYSDELKNRPVTFNDVEDIIIKNTDGTYSSMPNWKDKFKNHPNKTDDVVKNLPKLEQIPLDFRIEDFLKNISSTERKNMEIVKKGNAYFRELDNPESLKRLKEFGDEYNIDLLDAYKKAEERWDYGKNIGGHSKFKVKKTEEDWYGLSTTKWDYEDELRLFDLKQKFGEDSKEVSNFYKNISQEKSINYISDVVPLEKYEKTIWHELSHDINKSIIDKSPKLQEDIKNIFIEKGTADLNKVKKGREYVAKDFYTKKDEVLKDLDNPEKLQKIGEDEFDYVTRPTETWAFLSTNLRQDLKNTGVIKNYNEILTPEKLEQAIKNGNTVFSRFEPYIKDKDAFIKLFNKMTLSIAPAALYLQSQNQNKTEQ